MVKSRNTKNGFMFKLKSILLVNYLNYSRIINIVIFYKSILIKMVSLLMIWINSRIKYWKKTIDILILIVSEGILLFIIRSLNLYGFSSKKYNKGKILYINPNFNINSE